MFDIFKGIFIFSHIYSLPDIWPLGYKTFFMLNSTGHETSTAHKTKIQTNKGVSCFKYIRCCIYHANKNVKMPTIVGILTFMSRIFRAQLS